MYKSYKIPIIINNSTLQISIIDFSPINKEIIFCVHGITRNKHDFFFLGKELSDNGFRVISIDMAGRGESDWLTEKNNYNYEYYIQIILKIFTYLNLTNINYIGSSMGGILAIFLSAKFPKLFKKIILNDIGPYIEPLARSKIAKYISLYPTFIDKKAALKYLKFLLLTFNITVEEHWNHILEYSIVKKNEKYFLSFDPEIIVNFNNEIKLNKEFNIWEKWNKIPDNIPFLILRGENSKILSKDTADKMLKSRDNIELIEFSNTGHTPSLMNSNQINCIKKWLTKD